MKMDMQAYTMLCRIMGNMESDAQTYEHKEWSSIKEARNDMIADLRYYRDDLYRYMRKVEILDENEVL